MYDLLLSPQAVGGITLRNRVMQLATANRLESAGKLGADTIAFYAARAEGGVGAIVTGALSVHATGDHAFLPAHDPRNRDSFGALAAAVHEHGAAIFGQLNHVGRQHHQNGIPALVSSSAVPCPGSGGTPHELDIAEIEELIASYVASAVNLRAAGFDGVEVHGGQGYLLQQFLSPFSNKREDEFGGSLTGRTRFARRIIDGIRQECGQGFVVGLRLGVDEFVPGGLDIELSSEHMAFIHDETPVDYVSVTQANFASIEHHTPDRRFPRTPYVHYAAAIRGVVGPTPVVTCGRILDPQTAEAVLADGSADLIGLCRPLIADPEWVAKAAAARSDTIRRCISCNQCWGWIATARRIGCSVNPRTGHEAEPGGVSWSRAARPAAPARKRVVVIGAGPAGLQAATVSAALGHDTTVLERSEHVGGALLAGSVVAGYEELRWAVEDIAAETRAMGVRIELKAEGTVEAVLGLHPDVVLVATGAEPRTDDIAALTRLPVHSYVDVFAESFTAGDDIVVLDDDGYYAATAVAEYLAAQVRRVRVATPYFELGREIPATCRISTLTALDRLGIEILSGTWIAPAEGAQLRLRRVFGGREWLVRGVTDVVRVGNPRPRDGLYRQLVAAGVVAHRVADAYQPRRLFDALREGERLALAIS